MRIRSAASDLRYFKLNTEIPERGFFLLGTHSVNYKSNYLKMYIRDAYQ